MIDDGKVWLWIYNHPWVFFGAMVVLIVALALLSAYVLDYPSHQDLSSTLQVIQTQVAR